MNNCTIGEVVKGLRHTHELTIAQLAKQLNIGAGLLSKIEHNERELSFLVAMRLLDYTGLAIDEFAAMLSVDELNRTELSTIRYYQKKKIKT